MRYLRARNTCPVWSPQPSAGDRVSVLQPLRLKTVLSRTGLSVHHLPYDRRAHVAGPAQNQHGAGGTNPISASGSPIDGSDEPVTLRQRGRRSNVIRSLAKAITMDSSWLQSKIALRVVSRSLHQIRRFCYLSDVSGTVGWARTTDLLFHS